MTGIVYNACYGGFSLSREAILLARKISGDPKWGGPCLKGDDTEWGEPLECDYGSIDHIVERHDPVLVEVVRRLGDKASGTFSQLEIKEAEKGDRYRIDSYDGFETVVFEDNQAWSVVP